MRLFKRTVAFLLTFGLAAAILTGCFGGQGASEPTAPENMQTVPRQIRQGIQTVLLVSVKETDGSGETGSFQNPGRADMIMLMVIDEAAGKTRALHLNPDTLVPFAEPGTGETRQIPLGLTYSYGSGGSDSCLNLRRSVSQLLGGTPIDHYLTFTQDAVGIVNDLIGGADVEIGEAFPEAYPELKQGEICHLSGQNAVAFFDFRAEDDVTNAAHMGRQQQYIANVYGPFTENMQQENFLTGLTMQLGDRMATDMALSRMVQVMEQMEGCKLEETIVVLPGEAEKADGAYFFRADPEALRNVTEALFF